MSATGPTLLITLTLLVGCSDDAIGPSKFVDDYLDAYCSYIMRCCDLEERSYTTKDVCVEHRRPYVKDLVAAEAQTSFVSLVTDKARSCIDLLKSDCKAATAARDCLLAVTMGQHKSGEDCTYSPECESYYCIQPQKNTKGYCAGSSGGSCSGDDRACDQGSFCDETNLQCAPRKLVGDICHRPEHCISGVCSPQKLCVTAGTPFCDGE